MNNLVIEVHLHDDRFHGTPKWPPGSFRLFQAMVATLNPLKSDALDLQHNAMRFMETLRPPVIMAPPMKKGNSVTHYMPQNHFDAIAMKTPKNNFKNYSFDVAKAKTKREVVREVKLLKEPLPFIYVWNLTNDAFSKHIQAIKSIVEGIYRFGGGQDDAHAHACVLNDNELNELMMSYSGTIHEPSMFSNKSTNGWRYPVKSSFESLIDRYYSNRVVQTEPKYQDDVYYNTRPTRLIFKMRNCEDSKNFRSVPATDTVSLMKTVRDAVIARFSDFGFSDSALVNEIVKGSKNSNNKDKERRIRIVPLPTLGQWDGKIRRIMVEIPAGCPIEVRDFKDSIFPNLEIGTDTILIPSQKIGRGDMTYWYGLNDTEGFRTFYSITPAVLPMNSDKSMSKSELIVQAEKTVSSAVINSKIFSELDSVQVCRESFFVTGFKSGNYVSGTRFEAKKTWHVKITFKNPVHGPLVIGDGRYMGLGLMAPFRNSKRITT